MNGPGSGDSVSLKLADSQTKNGACDPNNTRSTGTDFSNFVILPKLLRCWVGQKLLTHEDNEPFDAHAIGVLDHLRHALVRCAALNSRQMAMQIPDHGEAVKRGIVNGKWERSRRHKAM